MIANDNVRNVINKLHKLTVLDKEHETNPKVLHSLLQVIDDEDIIEMGHQAYNEAFLSEPELTNKINETSNELETLLSRFGEAGVENRDILKLTTELKELQDIRNYEEAYQDDHDASWEHYITQHPNHKKEQIEQWKANVYAKRISEANNGK